MKAPQQLQVLNPHLDEQGNYKADSQWVSSGPVLDLFHQMSSEMNSLRKEMDSVKAKRDKPDNQVSAPVDKTPPTVSHNTPQRKTSPQREQPPPRDQPKGSAMAATLLNVTASDASLPGDPEGNREERWNQVMGAIKQNLPHMI